MAIKIKKATTPDNSKADEKAAVKSDGVIKQDAATKTTVTKSFLKTGNDAKKALLQEQEKVDADAELRTEARTFWLRPESQEVITFLDGNLDADGMLDVPLVYNHNVYNANMGVKGERIDVTCVQDQEPCPLCDHDKAALVGLLTIVQHTEFQGKDGETISNPQRLFMCKRGTLRELQEAATELGGLRGAQFRVRRTGKRKATVGDEFEYLGTLTDDQMEDNFPEPQPLDYEKALVFFSGAELYERGVVDGVQKGNNSFSDNHGSGNAAPQQSMASAPLGQAPKKGTLPNNFEDEL